MKKEIKGRKFLVAGFARSGKAVTDFLLKSGKEVVVYDRKGKEELGINTDEYKNKNVTFLLGRDGVDDMSGIDLVITSPGIKADNPVLKSAFSKGLDVVGELEFFYGLASGTIIAITGTNGKSTTTALTGEMIKQGGRDVVVGGNIGAPITGFLDRINDDTIVVIEVSSFQLETIRDFKPDISAVLNLRPSHLDRYADYSEYRDAKLRIFSNQDANSVLILNYDDKELAELRVNGPATLYFSRKESVSAGACVRGGRIVVRTNGKAEDVIGTEEIKLRGEHNLENALAACLIARVCGIDKTVLADTLRKFEGIEHRIEFVKEIRGVKFYNDSKATNIDSLIVALKSFNEKIVLIAGGRDKGCDYGQARGLLEEKVKKAFLLGEAKERMRKEFNGAVETEFTTDIEDAVNKAYFCAGQGDVVLFSPACSSFDMFRDYEERGRVFKREVGKLI